MMRGDGGLAAKGKILAFSQQNLLSIELQRRPETRTRRTKTKRAGWDECPRQRRQATFDKRIVFVRARLS